MIKSRFIIYISLAAVFFSCSDKMTAPQSGGGDGGESQQKEQSYDQGFSPIDESQALPSENGLLVSGVVLPKSFAPCLRSDELQVRMRGYSDECELIFIGESGTEYSADVLSYDEGVVVFKLPSEVLSGDYQICVDCGQERQSLGLRYVMCDTPSQTAGVNVTGTITISGQPASHIVVSDGYEFTVSDENGKYCLVSEKANGYVFVQTPAHAAAEVVNAIPQFYKHISSDKDKVDSGIDFKLQSRDHTKHRFLLVTDLHLDRQRNEADFCTKHFVPDMNNIIDQTEVPCYIFTAGDQTNELSWARYFDLKDWKNYIKAWKCPVYHCMGNHDNDMSFVSQDFKSEAEYKRVLGPTWYSMDIGDVHYVFLDNIVYDNNPAVTRERGYYVRITSDQLEYLKRDLLRVNPSTPVIIITHSPLYIADGIRTVTPRFETYEDIYALTECLSGFHEVHIISGHTHINQNTMVMPGVMEHNVAASSGSIWWSEYLDRSPHICRDGTIGGYQIWDMNGKSISWVHKPMGRSVKKGQFHCVDLNKVPEDLRGTTVENAVLINIYNWDDSWTLEVKENGRPLSFRQVYRADPTFKLVFPDDMDNSQLKPYKTDHLFMVTAMSPDSKLDITVTNRFGRKFTGEMTRPFDFKLENYE